MPGMFKGPELKSESPVTCLDRTSSATPLSVPWTSSWGLEPEKDALQEGEPSCQAGNRWEERGTGARGRRTFHRRRWRRGCGCREGAGVERRPELCPLDSGSGWLWRG